jgi:hypothetical protein
MFKPSSALLLSTDYWTPLIVKDESESQGAVIGDSEGEWGMALRYCGLKWSAIESSSHALLSISHLKNGNWPPVLWKNKKKKPNNFFLRSRVCLFLPLSLPYIYHLPHSFLISKKIFPFLSLIHIALSSLSSHLYLPHTYPQLAFQVTSTSHFCSFSLFLASDLTNPVAISAHLISI